MMRVWSSKKLIIDKSLHVTPAQTRLENKNVSLTLLETG